MRLCAIEVLFFFLNGVSVLYLNFYLIRREDFWQSPGQMGFCFFYIWCGKVMVGGMAYAYWQQWKLFSNFTCWVYWTWAGRKCFLKISRNTKLLFFTKHIFLANSLKMILLLLSLLPGKYSGLVWYWGMKDSIGLRIVRIGSKVNECSTG